MKAEKLYNLVWDLDEEAKATNLGSLLDDYFNTLSQSLSVPDDSNSQIFKASKTALDTKIVGSVTDSLSPSNNKILKLIGGTDYFGSRLKKHLQTIIESNVATPGQAIVETEQHITKAKEFYATVEALDGALKNFNIEPDFMSEDEYEIGVMLPPKLFSGKLDEFSQELKVLDRHLKAFGELTDDNSSSPTIRAVANGSVELFLDAIPSVANVVADALQSLTLTYLMILKIRVHRRGLQKANVGKEVLDAIAKEEKNKVAQEIKELAESLFKKYREKPDKTKDEEVKRKIENALTYMAERIDQGVDFEVSGADEFEDDDTLTPEQQTAREAKLNALEKLNAKGASIRSLPTRTEPILALPEPNGEEDGDV